MKQAFKNNAFLLAGVEKFKSTIRAAKVKMKQAGAESLQIDEAKLKAFSNREDIAALDLSPDEIRELYAADIVFDSYITEFEEKLNSSSTWPTLKQSSRKTIFKRRHFFVISAAPTKSAFVA